MPEIETGAAPLPNQKRIALSIILGFVVAFLALGLPMIGVTVNLYLGCSFLILAFILFAYGLFNWEKIHHWGTGVRVSALWGLGILYFAFVGFHVANQYRQRHGPRISVTTPPPSNLEAGRTVPHESNDPPKATHPVKTIKPGSNHIPKTRQSRAFVPDTAPPAKSSTYDQHCVGSACAQGPGSTANYNQYGAPKLMLTDAQENAVLDAMKPFANMGFSVKCTESVTEDMLAYATKLNNALNKAGLVEQVPPCRDITVLWETHPGLYVEFSPEYKDAVWAFAHTLRTSGAINSPLKVDVKPNQTGIFDLFITPNR
jgi:hypothetical protein